MARLTDDPPLQMPRPTLRSPVPRSSQPLLEGVLLEHFTWLLEGVLDVQAHSPASSEHASVLDSALTSLRAWMAREGIKQPSREYQALRAWLDTYGDRLVVLVLTPTGVELCQRLLYLVYVPAPDISGDMWAFEESPASRGVKDPHYLTTPGMTLGESLAEREREKAAARLRAMRDYEALSRDLLIALLVALLCARHPSVKTVVTPGAAVISRVARFTGI
ncbi:MAG: hypothetical protein R3E82_03880 [Pseudomonadales bacterium]